MLLLATYSFWRGDWALVYDSKIFTDFHNISNLFFFWLYTYIQFLWVIQYLTFIYLYRPLGQFHVIMLYIDVSFRFVVSCQFC